VKVYKYRLYPTKAQATKLRGCLNACRGVYNRCLAAKKDAWEKDKTSLSEFELNNMITQWRRDEPWMREAGTSSLQDVSRRVRKAYDGFFSRLKRGEKPGFPRFKGKFRYDSFTNPRCKCAFKDGAVKLGTLIGWTKARIHRLPAGEVKGFSVLRNRCGEWFVCMWFEPAQNPPTRPIDKSNNVGIDLGCAHFATLSNGKKIENPRFLKTDAKALAKAQRKEKWGAAAKIHKRIANRRHNFHHQVSRRIVNEYDLIFAENLNVKGINASVLKTIRKSSIDAAWGQFLNLLSYKAAEAGRVFGKVDPAYTTQTCSECGERHKLELSERTFECACGHRQDRDVNAARNILAVGLHGLSKT
jgi:putative transposase